jgi:2-polyprenyl-3-methyl-5-hydroxy-6-metoxy-1,4-benzoquinol methylase
MIEQLINEILGQNKLHRRVLEAEYGSLSSQEREDLLAYMKYCAGNGISIDHLAKSYNLVVKDMVKEQIHFKRSRNYRFSSYAEVAGLVYDNPEYMGMYMYGLAISTFLWQNHRLMRKFFIDSIPKDAGGSYIEVGPGHGHYFIEAMKATHYKRFVGIDISATSAKMTEDIISGGFYGTFSGYEIINADFLSFPSEAQYDALVMSEVIEHVENPKAFLDRAYEVTTARPFIYLSTCINAPAVDHITLFRTMDDVRGLIDACRLTIEKELVVPYNSTTLEKSVAEALPINVALVLSKA